MNHTQGSKELKENTNNDIVLIQDFLKRIFSWPGPNSNY